MKRPYTAEFSGVPVSDIRKDITQEQLAAIGAIALAYNYAENTIRRMVLPALRMPVELHRDVVSRINGADGLIEIVKLGAKSLRLSDTITDFLAESLGVFKIHKKYREAVIHARILNKDAGIGELVESRGVHSEVLLTADALNACYDHISALRPELSALLLVMIEALNLTETADDPEKSQLAAKIQGHFAQAQKHRTRRLSLPPIPGFPDAAELHVLGSMNAQESPDTLTGLIDVGTLGLSPRGREIDKNPPSGES
jgi:hypothetical protein